MSNLLIAMDLGRGVFEVAVAKPSGKVVERKRLTRAQFERFWEMRGPCRVVMDACSSAHHWARHLFGLGFEVSLLPPRYVRPYRQRGKTDRIDCDALLEPGRSPRIKAAAVKSRDQQDGGSLFLLTSPGGVGTFPLDFKRTMRPEILMASQHQADVLRGSIELLVLKTLSLAPMHGWGIGQRIQQISKGALEVNQGSLYPALQRLEQRGLITSEWQTTQNNRRARYYRITPAGTRALGTETDSWRRFAATMETILRTT